jgi:hypothetical protein
MRAERQRRGPRGAPSVLLIALPVLIVVTGCAGSDEAVVARSTTVSASSVVGKREERPTALVSPAPARGTVRVVDGAFTDRVRLTGTRLRTGDRPAVVARIQGSVDVSELLVLEVRADFYDVSGRYVNSGRAVFKDLHAGPQNQPASVVIAAGATNRPIASALVSIPQLVNE